MIQQVEQLVQPFFKVECLEQSLSLRGLDVYLAGNKVGEVFRVLHGCERSMHTLGNLRQHTQNLFSFLLEIHGASLDIRIDSTGGLYQLHPGNEVGITLEKL